MRLGAQQPECQQPGTDQAGCPQASLEPEGNRCFGTLRVLHQGWIRLTQNLQKGFRAGPFRTRLPQTVPKLPQSAAQHGPGPSQTVAVLPGDFPGPGYTDSGIPT